MKLNNSQKNFLDLVYRMNSFQGAGFVSDIPEKIYERVAKLGDENQNYITADLRLAAELYLLDLFK